MSNWEGGIRVSSFVSGGFVPSARRGTMYRGLVAAFDFYAILVGLAGGNTSDPAAAEAQLPSVDALDLSASLFGLSGGVERTELVIGTQDASVQNVAGLLWVSPSPTGVPQLFKLLTGLVNQDAHSGPLSPNATENATLQFPPAPADEYTRNCTTQGCLFDVSTDIGERKDLVAEPDLAGVVAYMLARLRVARNSSLVRTAGTTDEGACVAAQARGGYWGPWLK